MFVTRSTESNAGKEIDNTGLERLQDAVSRYCLSLTGSPWDAEDLAQDTWAKAIDTLRGIGHVNSEAFLLRIAKNTWIDQTRRKIALSQILRKEFAEPAHQLSESGNLETEIAFEALRKHLSPLQRAVFLLRDVFGFSAAETAVRLRTTVGAVKTALHRARISLDAVKEELVRGVITLPKEEGLKLFLRAIVFAYQSGDLARLVELVQQDAIEPVIAVGIAQARLLRARQNRGGTSGSTPTMSLAA